MPSGLGGFRRRGSRSAVTIASRRLRSRSSFRSTRAGWTAPNLDVFVSGRDHAVAVESKLTEYIATKHTAKFKDGYDGAVERLADPSWRAAYERLRRIPDEFADFNAAQIVKHYLGLKADRGSTPIGTRPVTLLYLYWQPTDHDAHPFFQHHRDELTDFAKDLADPQITFQAMSYAELWDDGRNGAVAGGHAEGLRARYQVSAEPSRLTDAATST